MESSLYRFVLKHAPRETAILCFLTAISLPFYYLSLDIPKNIFNQAILAKGIQYPVAILGVDFSQVAYLFLLCFFFFVMVLINGGFKQHINTFKGRLGERLLRRLRYELVSRIMRFPLPHFRKVSQGELIPMITAEVEPLGGFMGDAIAQPLIQGGMLLTIITFLFVQNPLMGLAAISLYPIQGYVIPKLQRRVNQLGKERVRAVRKLSERVGEAVSGVQEIHCHGTAAYERADFSDRLGLIFSIRFEIYQRKSFVKFLNNLLNQMAPLLFYSIGGWLVIHGELTAGALAAALTANKDMSAPWKELLDYYQQSQDTKIKYEQVTEQFRPESMLDEKLQEPIAEAAKPLSGPVSAASVVLAEDSRTRLIENVSFKIAPGETIAMVGPIGGGKEALAMLLARLYLPTGGKLTVGGRDMATIPEAEIGARIGYVGQSAFLFATTVRENLAYGLRQRPVAPCERSDAEKRARDKWLAESARAGNLTLDAEANWIDHERAGVDASEGLTARMETVLTAVHMADDVYQFGLRGTIDPKLRPDIAEAILKARAALRSRLVEPAFKTLVEPFHPERYNANATVAENLLFGTPVDPAFEIDRLAANEFVLEVLEKAGIAGDLVAAGRQIAETMVELFADLPPDHEFFDQFSFISSDDLPEFQAILARTGQGQPEMRAEDRSRLLTLAFKLIEARHRLGLIDDALRTRILAARTMMRERLSTLGGPAVEFFDPVVYNAAATIQDNILFGKVAYGQAGAVAAVVRLIGEVLDTLDLRPTVLEAGLGFPVGIAGSRLTLVQRQKLAIARALLKRPDLLIINEATATFDAQAQAKVMDGVFKECEGRILVWVLHNPTLAQRFARVMVVADGRIAESGTAAELGRAGSLFAGLLAAA